MRDFTLSLSTIGAGGHSIDTVGRGGANVVTILGRLCFFDTGGPSLNCFGSHSFKPEDRCKTATIFLRSHLFKRKTDISVPANASTSPFLSLRLRSSSPSSSAAAVLISYAETRCFTRVCYSGAWDAHCRVFKCILCLILSVIVHSSFVTLYTMNWNLPPPPPTHRAYRAKRERISRLLI